MELKYLVGMVSEARCIGSLAQSIWLEHYWHFTSGSHSTESIDLHHGRRARSRKESTEMLMVWRNDNCRTTTRASWSFKKTTLDIRSNPEETRVSHRQLQMLGALSFSSNDELPSTGRTARLSFVVLATDDVFLLIS